MTARTQPPSNWADSAVKKAAEPALTGSRQKRDGNLRLGPLKLDGGKQTENSRHY